MNHKYDAIIIGAGIIGASIAFDLAKKGKKTLNVDLLPAAGYGSTSYSCAIIRTHYSNLDSTALAYEAFFAGSIGLAILDVKMNLVWPNSTVPAVW